jgi:hypothetical protein
MRIQYFIKHRQKTEENEKMLFFCVANFFLDFPVKLDLYLYCPLFSKVPARKENSPTGKKLGPFLKVLEVSSMKCRTLSRRGRTGRR